MNLRLITIVWTCLLALGCARPTLKEVHSLQIGTTSEAEVIKLFGKPTITESTTEDGSPTRKIGYWNVYGASNVGPVVWLNYYWCAVEWKNGLVEGYYYVCNHGSKDKTRFDTSLIDSIQNGQTRESVIAQLGPPNGILSGKTKLEDFRDYKSDDVAEFLIYTEAPPIEGLFMPKEASVTSAIVKIGNDGKVVGKIVTTDQVNFR